MHQLGADGVGEAADRELGAAVGGLQRDGTVGERRADLHDDAAVARDHAPERRHRPVDGSEVGHLGRAPELLRRHVDEPREHGRHRVVHPDVDRAELAFAPLGRGLDLSVVGHVGLDDDRRPAERLDLATRLVEPLDAPRDEAHARSAAGERVRDRAPHAGRGAGDDDDLPVHDA